MSGKLVCILSFVIYNNNIVSFDMNRNSIILDKENPWQLPILYDLETDRVVYNATMMTDEIFQANRPKEILLTEKQSICQK